jgi:hypothetical protein
LEEFGRKSLWHNWGVIQEFTGKAKRTKKIVSVAGDPPQNSNWTPPEYKNRWTITTKPTSSVLAEECIKLQF